MSKILKVKFPDQCNGCELCVMEMQRQLGKVGLDGALIRIFKKVGSTQKLEFSVELDPRINSLDIDKVVGICPRDVFMVTEEDNVEYIK